MEAIDLALSIKWADCNIGATAPEDMGDGVSWGETQTKDKYDKKSYSFYVNKNEGMKNAHGPNCDMAKVKCGQEWRMPTIDEVKELFEKCKYEWGVRNGIEGALLTSNLNGNSIFFPATGIIVHKDEESAVQSRGCVGYYWTASICPNEDLKASCCIFNRRFGNPAYEKRECGLFIRPVLSSEWDDSKMFLPEIKEKPSSQYFLGYKKSGPILKFLYYTIYTFLFLVLTLFVFGGIIGLIVNAAIVSAIMLPSRKFFFNKTDAKDVD